jgi:prenyltransferase beta subunit
MGNERLAQLRLHWFILISLLLLSWALVTTPAVRSTERRCSRLLEGVDTTRLLAVRHFLAALQRDDGGFVDDLSASRETEGLETQPAGIEGLAAIQSLDAIDGILAAQYVARCQRSDGAMVEEPRYVGQLPPSPLDAQDAARALAALGMLGAIDGGKLIQWILSCQRADGGFNELPGQPDYALDNTVPAIWALLLLGATFDQTKVADNLMTYYSSVVGGFGDVPEGETSFPDTYEGMTGLKLLGELARVDRATTEQYVLDYYDNGSCSFGYGSGAAFRGYVLTIYQGVLMLQWLNVLSTINATGTAAFVLSCQSPEDGGFLSFAGMPRSDIGSTWAALGCLTALGQLNLLQEAFTVAKEPVWTGAEYPTTSTPGTTLRPEDVLVIVLVVALAGTLGVCLFISLVRQKPGHRIRRVNRRRLR